MNHSFFRNLKSFFDNTYMAVKEVNNRYKEPRIHMSKGVKFALLMLRLYLLFLIGLMIFKFITILYRH